MKIIKKSWLVTLIIVASVASADLKEEVSINPEADIFLYKAIPGDSLWNVAQRHLHNIKLWTDLKKINGLPDDDYIEPGTLIRIPRDWIKTNQSNATLINVIGDVKIINNEKQTLELGTDFSQKDHILLSTGDTIITGDDGLATILFKDGSRLLLVSNSELVLNDLIALGDGSLSDIKLRLEKGRLENRVYSSPISNTNYEVKTATATTAVRGTTFRMGIENDESITEVIAGLVVSKSDDGQNAPTELSGGQAIIIAKDGEAKQVAMLPPPEFSNFPQLIEHVPIKIDVEKVSDVAGYYTKIVPVGDDDQDAVSSVRSQENILMGDDLPDGRYKMLVSAIAEDGVTGQPATYEFILNARPFAADLDQPIKEEKILLKDLIFNWKKVNDESKSYYLQVAKDQAFRDIVIDADNLTELSYIPSNLFSGVYFWRVASIEENGMRGPFSEPQNFRVLLADPNLEVAKAKTSDIDLEWAPLEAGTTYLIQVSDNVDFNNVLLEKSLQENNLHVEKLVPGTYYFRIQSTASDNYVSEWGLPHKFEIRDIESVSEKIQR